MVIFTSVFCTFTRPGISVFFSPSRQWIEVLRAHHHSGHNHSPLCLFVCLSCEELGAQLNHPKRMGYSGYRSRAQNWHLDLRVRFGSDPVSFWVQVPAPWSHSKYHGPLKYHPKQRWLDPQDLFVRYLCSFMSTQLGIAYCCRYIYICIMIYVPKTLIANALALAGARLYTSFWLNYNNPLTWK